MKHVLLLVFALGWAALSAASAENRADVLVVSATPAGVAAAVSAARRETNVVLIEESDHVGGIIAGGGRVIQLYALPGGNFEVNSDHPHQDTAVSAESLNLIEYLATQGPKPGSILSKPAHQ